MRENSNTSFDVAQRSNAEANTQREHTKLYQIKQRPAVWLVWSTRDLTDKTWSNRLKLELGKSTVRDWLCSGHFGDTWIDRRKLKRWRRRKIRSESRMVGIKWEELERLPQKTGRIQVGTSIWWVWVWAFACVCLWVWVWVWFGLGVRKIICVCVYVCWGKCMRGVCSGVGVSSWMRVWLLGDLRWVARFGLKWAKSVWAKSKHLQAASSKSMCTAIW